MDNKAAFDALLNIPEPFSTVKGWGKASKRGVDAPEALALAEKILKVIGEGRPTKGTAMAALRCAEALMPSLNLGDSYLEVGSIPETAVTADMPVASAAAVTL